MVDTALFSENGDDPGYSPSRARGCPAAWNGRGGHNAKPAFPTECGFLEPVQTAAESL